MCFLCSRNTFYSSWNWAFTDEGAYIAASHDEMSLGGGVGCGTLSGTQEWPPAILLWPMSVAGNLRPYFDLPATAWAVRTNDRVPVTAMMKNNAFRFHSANLSRKGTLDDQLSSLLWGGRAELGGYKTRIDAPTPASQLVLWPLLTVGHRLCLSVLPAAIVVFRNRI